jgi:large subunit ribosomal protein L21
MNRFVRTGTIAAAIVGAIVAAALIVKEQLTGPAPALSGETPASPSKPVAPAPSKAPAAPKPRKAPAKPKPAAAPTATDDDLTEINGIGPVYKTKLAEAGITTFAQLGKVDASEIAEAIEAPVSRVQAWIDAARRRRA